MFLITKMILLMFKNYYHDCNNPLTRIWVIIVGPIYFNNKLRLLAYDSSCQTLTNLWWVCWKDRYFYGIPCLGETREYLHSTLIPLYMKNSPRANLLVSFCSPLHVTNVHLDMFTSCLLSFVYIIFIRPFRVYILNNSHYGLW